MHVEWCVSLYMILHYVSLPIVLVVAFFFFCMKITHMCSTVSPFKFQAFGQLVFNPHKHITEIIKYEIIFYPKAEIYF